MSAIIKHTALGIVCFAAGFFMGKQETNPNVAKTIEKSDTVRIVRIDTCNINIPQYKYVRVTDTFTIKIDSTRNVHLPITQKHYAKDSVYDAWVSGYNPQLDSISIYERIENKTITKTIVKFLENKKWDVYYYAGLSKNHDENYATLGVTINSPRKWSLGLNAGIGDNGNICYGFNIGFKIK